MMNSISSMANGKLAKAINFGSCVCVVIYAIGI